jgi:hypothetical protein
MKIHFRCPECDYPGRLVSSETKWQCPQCDYVVDVPETIDRSLPSCVVCGNHELYKKKDFPHGLGLSILAFACLASTVTYLLYLPYWTWGILLGSAAFDGLLYLWVGDVVVCYRCNAHHRGVEPSPDHKPYELTIGERYRQEQIRREMLEQEQRR